MNVFFCDVFILLFVLQRQYVLDRWAVKERRVLQSLTAELQKLQCRYDEEKQQHKQASSSLHLFSELIERWYFMLRI